MIDILKRTIKLRLALKKIINQAPTDTRKKSSSVAVEIAAYDAKKQVLSGMTHTPVTGSEIYQTHIDLSSAFGKGNCSCKGNKHGHICKHLVRLAVWLDDRLALDQKAMEQVRDSTLLGSYELRKAFERKRSA